MPSPPTVHQISPVPRSPLAPYPTDNLTFMFDQNPQFLKMLALLKELKHSKSKEIIDSGPMMCSSCWMIICKKDVSKHPKKEGHELTGTFKDMQEANKAVYMMFCKEKGHVKKDGSHNAARFCPLLRLSKNMQKILQANTRDFAGSALDFMLIDYDPKKKSSQESGGKSPGIPNRNKTRESEIEEDND